MAVDCERVAAAILAGTAPAPRPRRGQECNLSLTSDPGSLQANAITIDVLARVLGPSGLGREVVNRTGLSGTFDVDLLYLPGLPMGGVSADRLAQEPVFQGRPALVTALREQLGLRLEPATGPVQVLVVERAERPTEN